MIRTDSILPLLAAGMTLLFLLAGWLFYDYGWVVMRFPLLAGALTIGAALPQLLRQRREPVEPGPPPGRGHDGGVAAEFSQYLAIAAILPAVWILGFVFGSALFLLGFLRWRGTGWGPAAAMAAGTALFLHGVFVQLLRLQLHTGVLG
ncbi:MAG: tripartite tricarboxylate transporter TctB family protein [Gammaproteobacteria bacterium]|nr:tripartite tricarboxylate transporter TctB family protein [Gammaproteobacteria bacterium]